jgi:Holliday junction resolvasome RuvABC endonuclease subunit
VITVAGVDPSLTSSGVTVLTDDPARIPYPIPAAPPRPDCVWPAVLRCIGIAGHETDGWQERNRRIRAVSQGIRTLIKAHLPIDLAVIEAPLPRTTQFYSYGDRFSLFHTVYGTFDALGIPVAVMVNQHGHQFVTGLGRVSEDKHEVIEACEKWWPGVVAIPNHDLGDALGLAMAGVMHLGGVPPFRPAARHYSIVHAQQWPGQPRKPKTWAQAVKAKKARRG